MAKKRESKNEFRFNYDTGHMNYVFEEEGNKYHSVGITHDRKTFGKKNMPLDVNPQDGHNEKAYIRNGIITNKKRSYFKSFDNSFKFSESDFPKIKSKIRNYKSRRK